MIGIGSTVGNYVVSKKLGSGAMGSVYLAEHPTIGKKVALKVIHADLAENEEMLSRFFNEARAVTQIGHQNIVEVIDFGQTPDGDNFIVMELLIGRSLGDKLKETPILAVDDAIRMAVQIADGLEASHQRGIIHRDLKPDNVYLVTRLGIPDYVKILDFGLAKLTQGGGAMSHKTRAGSVLGTPHYMAPEQCEGRPDIDNRVDVYALGCIMFQMLCGRVPFPGEGFGEVLVKHLREPPTVPTKLNPDIPRPIEAIILHALAKRKEFRFQSMKEMARALRNPAGYVREISGEAPLSSPTMETAAPLLPPVSPILIGRAPPPVRAPGPVAKANDAAPTMMDEVPASVRAALAAAGSRPPPDAPPRSGGGGNQATMLFDASAPPVGSDAGPAHEDDLRPARSVRLDRVAIVGGVGLALVLVVLGGARIFGAAARTPAAAAVDTARPRVVIVASDPPGADVLRDGKSLGSAPVVLKFQAGEAAASIKVRLDGFVDGTRTVDATNEGQVVVRLTAAPDPNDAPPVAVPVLLPVPVPVHGSTRPVAALPPAPAEHVKPVTAAALPGTPPAEKKPPRPKRPPKKPVGDGDEILVPDF